MIMKHRLVGAMLLVAGTCIGAGMLALPVVSSPAGLYYAVGLLLVCWVFMTLSAFLILEVNLSLQGEPSYISMAYATLGRWGGFTTWISVLGLLYALLAAYLAGGAIF